MHGRLGASPRRVDLAAYLVHPPTKPTPPKLTQFCAHVLEHVHCRGGYGS
jgi:hypothetical protein